MALLFELTQKLSQGFSALWARYPLKKSKQDAEKAFGQVVKTPAIEEQIHAALDWQIPEWEAMDWYTPPLLGTYLRKERFTDEPTKPKAPTMTRSHATVRPFTTEAVTQRTAVSKIQALIQSGMDPEAAKRQVYLELGWIKE